MPLYQPAYDKLLNLIQTTFKTEKDYYSHDKVAVTAHWTGKSNEENWTQKLLDIGILTTPPDPTKNGNPALETTEVYRAIYRNHFNLYGYKKAYQALIAAQKENPHLKESDYMNADRFIELERTLTALYCYLLVLDGSEAAYDALITAQKENPQLHENDYLTLADFKLKHRRIASFTPEKQEVLMHLIVSSDIAKSPRVKEILIEQGLLLKYPDIKLAQDTDGLMTDILRYLSDNEIIKILPSFQHLSDPAKILFKEIYPLMNACHGHIFFLERGKQPFEITATHLAKIPYANQKTAIQLVNEAQLFDAMGSQGQKNIFGSVIFTRNYATGYNLFHAELEELPGITSESQSSTIDMLFETYLQQRGDLLGFELPLSPTDRLLTRIGCSIRGFIPEFGELLTTTFDNLPAEHQTVLLTQLGFEEEGLEGWTKVNYIATLPQNLSLTSFDNGNLEQAITEAVNGSVCFALLLQEIAAENKEAIKDPNISISFGEVAWESTKYPERFNPATFNAKEYSLDLNFNKIVKKPKAKTLDSSIVTSISQTLLGGSLNKVANTAINNNDVKLEEGKTLRK